MKLVFSSTKSSFRALSLILCLSLSAAGIVSLTAGSEPEPGPVDYVVDAGGLGTPAQLGAVEEKQAESKANTDAPAGALAPADLPVESVVPIAGSSASPITQTAEGISAQVYAVAPSYSFVTGESPYGTSAGFAVADSAAAPKSYSFEISDGTAVLHLIQSNSGVVYVVDAAGKVVNFLNAPWAIDADGRSVPTHYTVSGDVVTQSVDTAGAAFPVVADPALACSGVFCTSEYNKTETREVAEEVGAWGGVVSAGCGLLDPLFGLACGISTAWVVSEAQTAHDEGKCFGIQLFIPTLTEYPVIYSGGNCK